LRDAIRTTDIAGRYGGEEFGVILIDSTADNSMVVAERLRTTIEALTVKHAEHTIRYTISLGIAGISSDMRDYKAWLMAADQGLYLSKHSGRNRSSVYRAPPA
jgi:diguanylate cyclase (GGDEF)-like protein